MASWTSGGGVGEIRIGEWALGEEGVVGKEKGCRGEWG